MKNTMTILAGLLVCTCASAQNVYLEPNLIRARFNSNGDMFSTYGTVGGFEVPKGSGKSTIYTGNIWIGGINNALLHMAAETYRQGGSDFQPGPVGVTYNVSTYHDRYNRLWSVSRAEIETHKNNWNKQGYTTPASIKDWPGNGNTANGEAQKLAPFHDANSNGLYEPANGDYPLIRGDQAVYFIVNDDKAHGSQGAAMKIEVHGMAYAFNIPTDPALNQTVFVNYKIYNRSGKTYSDMHFGTFIDFDLGNYGDDFVGCNPKKNMFFASNGDNNDDGPLGYGTLLPAQGVMFLSHPLSRFVYFNNDNSPTGNPTQPYQYYNYLKGVWKDSTAISYGNNGHGGNDPAHFMFPGGNDPQGRPVWDENTVGNTPGDRRALGSIGPFAIWPNTWLCVDLAFPFAQNHQVGPPADAVKLLEKNADRVTSFYNQQQYPCYFVSGIEKKNVEANNLRLYPNPAQDMISIETGAETLPVQIDIRNLLGQTVKQIDAQHTQQAVSVAGLAAGVYVCVAYVNGEVVQTQKLVKR